MMLRYWDRNGLTSALRDPRQCNCPDCNAIDETEECPSCRGDKVGEDMDGNERECPRCRGTGEVAKR
jgi:DnaJ-class molecular chaperone